MNPLSPLSFDDFLRTPRTAGDTESAYSFSTLIVPPTPQDMVLVRPMISPVYGQFNSPSAWGSLMSPSPLTTGIMTSNDKAFHQPTLSALRPRSPSVESRASHRHSPYDHSRKSSGASTSSMLLGQNGDSSGRPADAVNPAQLGSINPAFLRPGGESGRASDASDHGSNYGYNVFPQLEDSDDSDSEHDEPAVPSKGPPPRRSLPSITAIQNTYTRTSTPARSETASHVEREEGRSRLRRTTKPKRRPAALVEDPAPVKLVTAITASGKKSHARKRPEDHIPRPRNAFILFRKHVVDAKLIPPEVEIRHQNISVVVSKMWAEADPETKTKFQEEARIEKEAHMRNYPDYKYQPVYRRANVVRRKMKPDPVEEKRCTFVASLLLEGKEGAELEAGAAKAVEASNKKRLKIQKALAAKEARQVRQTKRSATSRKNRRASAESRKRRSESEESSGSYEEEDEEEEISMEQHHQGEPSRRHFVEQPCGSNHPAPHMLWADGPQEEYQEETAYAGMQSDNMFHYETGLETAPVYQHDMNYQAPHIDQPTWEDSLPALTALTAPNQYEQTSTYSHTTYGAPQYHMPISQPSDYISAMYDNGVQPMGFTAGPPGDFDNGILFNPQGNDGVNDLLDFDMRHYKEALADVSGFSGGVWH